MAALDTNKGYKDAQSKISTLKTVNQSLKDQKSILKQNANSSFEKAKTDNIKALNDLKNQGTSFIKQQKDEKLNQLEQLFNLYKSSLPTGKSVSIVKDIFLESTNTLKTKVKDYFIDEVISTVGCSEEQTYDDKLNQPIYIKVSQIDIFKTLKYSPNESKGKYFYEESDTTPGIIPYSLDRELYKRLENLNISFNTENSSFYKGASGSDLFDIEYVQFYPSVLPTNFGDYYKITLKPQLNNKNSITSFLYDYYNSIEIFDFNIMSANLINSISGNLDRDLKKSRFELESDSWFLKVIKRLMGLCNDPNQKIDVSGTAKLSEEDFIDDSFFEIEPADLKNIDQEINKIFEGVVEFESCEGVKLPVNDEAMSIILDDIIKENTGLGKVEALNQGIESMVNDKAWKDKLSDGFKFGFNYPSGLNLKLDLDVKIALSLPRLLIKSVLTPKTLLGLMIAIKSSNSELSLKIDNQFDDISGFMKTFKKLIVNFTQKVVSEFVEILFKNLKKNILLIVETILLEIIEEAKDKQLRMYSAIIYVLLVLGQAVVDFRNCKSVIDEILKLLNLGLKQLNVGLPLFALAGASLLSGASPLRAFANTIENLQKAGLPTGDLPDGTPNLMNLALKSVSKGSMDEMFENGKVEAFIPSLKVVVPGLAGPGTTFPSKSIGKFF
jgi:hypothetical protein